MKWTEKKVGLALGGGGVRGFSHIGVLRVLEQEGIDIDLIVGTSAGALIGAAYASGQSPREIQVKVESYLRSPEFNESTLKSIGMAISPRQKGFLIKTRDLFRHNYYLLRAFFSTAVLPSEDFKSLIHYFIPEISIHETRIPFCAVTTDLISGKEVVFSDGPLRQAVLASCSVPGALEPIRQGEWLLADGGITSLVPVHAARKAGADVVIAVTVDRDLTVPEAMETAQAIVYRAGEITSSRLQDEELADADVIIRPKVGDLHWMDYSRAGDLIVKGEEAAREALGEIHSTLPLYRKIVKMAGRFLSR